MNGAIICGVDDSESAKGAASLLGSVAAEVSRRAPCPVVVVPPGADANVEG